MTIIRRRAIVEEAARVPPIVSIFADTLAELTGAVSEFNITERNKVAMVDERGLYVLDSFAGGGIGTQQTPQWRPIGTDGASQAVPVAAVPVIATLTTASEFVVITGTLLAVVTLNLPIAPLAGQVIEVKDGVGNAAAFAITLDGDQLGTGKQIQGANTLVIGVNFGAVRLKFSAGVDEWLIENVYP